MSLWMIYLDCTRVIYWTFFFINMIVSSLAQFILKKRVISWKYLQEHAGHSGFTFHGSTYSYHWIVCTLQQFSDDLQTTGTCVIELLHSANYFVHILCLNYNSSSLSFCVHNCLPIEYDYFSLLLN